MSEGMDIKVKHISIKDFYVRVKKKNKTRGRPSNLEIYTSQILSACLVEIRPEIYKAFEDVLLYGTGILEITYPTPNKE